MASRTASGVVFAATPMVISVCDAPDVVATPKILVGLVGNETCDRVKGTQLQTTVTHNADDRHAEVGAERQELFWALPVFEMQSPNSVFALYLGNMSVPSVT